MGSRFKGWLRVLLSIPISVTSLPTPSLSYNFFRAGAYVTFHQAKQLGGSIKKGEHGTPIVFWKLLERVMHFDRSRRPLERHFAG